MKHFFFFATLVLIFISETGAQSTFFNRYGSNVGEDGERIVTVPGGGYLIGGQTDAAGYGWKDIALTRVSATGSLMWCRKLGTNKQEYLTDIVAIPSGGFYVMIIHWDAYWTQPYQSTIVTKLDANGTVLWTKQYSALAHYDGLDMIVTSNGGFVFMAAFDSAGQLGGRVSLTSCSSTGSVNWSRRYITSGEWGVRDGLVECSNGDYAMMVRTGDINNNSYMTLLRVTNTGTLLWCKEHPIPYGEMPLSMVYANNSFYVYSNEQDTMRISCFNGSGLSAWRKSFIAMLSLSYGWNKMRTGNNKLLISGQAYEPTSVYNGVLIELDTSGTVLTSGLVNSGLPTLGNEAVYNSNGDIAFCGTLYQYNNGTDTACVFLNVGSPSNGTMCGYVAIPFITVNEAPLTTNAINIATVNNISSVNFTFLTSTGTSVYTGCTVGFTEEEHHEVSLYPNPVNDYLTVESPYEQSVFMLFNNLGQCVLTEQLTGGRSEITVSGLAEGVYFYRLESEGVAPSSGKLIIE